MTKQTDRLLMIEYKGNTLGINAEIDEDFGNGLLLILDEIKRKYKLENGLQYYKFED